MAALGSRQPRALTGKPMDLKISFAGRPVNSQPCVFSESFTLAPGESRDFKASGAVLGDEWIDFDFRVAAGSRTCCSRRLKFRCNAPPHSNKPSCYYYFFRKAK